jgi:hypothetical protein
MMKLSEAAIAMDDENRNEMESEWSLNPHFSPAFYCGGGSGHVCVALRRAPRRTVEYACGALGRAGQRLPDAPCIHVRLRLLATKPGEKSGLIFPGSERPPQKAFGFCRIQMYIADSRRTVPFIFAQPFSKSFVLVVAALEDAFAYFI